MMQVSSQNTLVPIDIKLLEISAQGRELARQMIKQQDDENNDILAYSAVNTKSEDDDTIFSSGGAILEALAEQNPGIKEAVK